MNLFGTFLYKIYYFDFSVSQKLLQLDEILLEFCTKGVYFNDCTYYAK